MRGLILAVTGFGGVVIGHHYLRRNIRAVPATSMWALLAGRLRPVVGRVVGPPLVLPAGLPVVLRARLMLVLARILPAALALG